MKILYRFLADTKKYLEYIKFAGKSQLKGEVAGSYLGWIWWILDPLFFMLVYTFVVQFVFDRGGPDFPIFVFVGLTAWNFMNNTVTSSVTIIKSYRGIISKVYLPKFVLILVRIYKNLIKMGISFLLVLVLMLFFNVQYSWKLVFLIFVLIVHVITTFSISLIVAHIGVFVSDFSNILSVILRFLFYLSGILYSVIDRIPEPFTSILFGLDPIAFIIQAYRDIIMLQKFPNIYFLLHWFIIGISTSVLFLKIMYKYENTYVKVVQHG